MMYRAWRSIEEVPYFEVIYQISRTRGQKNRRFESYLCKIIKPVAANKSFRFTLFAGIWFFYFDSNVIAIGSLISKWPRYGFAWSLCRKCDKPLTEPNRDSIDLFLFKLPGRGGLTIFKRHLVMYWS